MNNWFGYLIIAIQWGTTIFGILYKIFAKKVNEKFSLILYLIMGWLVLAILPAIISQTTPLFWSLMVSGGLCYTVGAGFYAKKKPYFHMIWHLFILAASATPSPTLLIIGPRIKVIGILPTPLHSASV